MNIVKHAGSNQALIAIEQDSPMVRIEVTDYGIGFTSSGIELSSSKDGGFGLFNIRQRLRHLGGNITIQSEPGSGTRVVMQLPETNYATEVVHDRQQ
jgi:signal transduction histidine kinase